MQGLVFPGLPPFPSLLGLKEAAPYDLASTLKPHFNIGHFEPSASPCRYCREDGPGTRHDGDPQSSAKCTAAQASSGAYPWATAGPHAALWESSLLQNLLCS